MRGVGHVGCAAVSVEVRPVAGRRDRRGVHRAARSACTLPRTPWVPPLRLERRLFLQPPAQRVLQARRRAAVPRPARRPRRRAGQRAGRPRLQRLPRQRAGACSASSSSRTTRRSCRALLDAAAAWLRARGRDRMVGPMDFTMNDESGVLIEGFEREPMIKQPWHPPYYASALRGGGPREGDGPVDVGARDLRPRARSCPIIFELAEQVEPKHGITLRKMTRRSLRRDLDRFAEVYNSAWSAQLGLRAVRARRTSTSTPQELQLVLRLAVVHGRRDAASETVAVAITVPDVNQVLRRMNGRLLPFGWWHFLRRRQDHRPLPRRLPRRQARVPAHRRGRRALRRALRPRRAHAASSGARWAGSWRPTAP